MQGGAGAGGAFEISFKIGTGNERHDDIVVSIAPASVADLSTGLAVGSVTSMVGASTARTNVASAVEVLDTIRAGIAGDIERFSIASRNNSVISRGLNETREALTNPAVVIDLVQLVARRATEDGGYRLDDRTVDQLRQLLISLSGSDNANNPITSSGLDQSEANTGKNAGGAETGESYRSVAKNQDAA